ncbi:DUF2018 family protein [Helicobacter sp. 23-1048]
MQLDDLELFGKPPLEKWKEIMQNASPTLVGLELERLLEEVAILELFIESKGLDSNEVGLFSRGFDEEQKENLRAMKDSLAIESMGNILGNHE